jgi:predicted GIY-YIG superfamily endonuclease
MFFVYILVCEDGSFYVGHTQDVEQRMTRHQDGTAAAYTHKRSPVRLAHVERHPSRESAVARERQIKGWTRDKKEALIRGDLDMLHRLSRRRRR